MPRGLSSRVCPAGREAALLEPWKWGHVLGMAGASASPHARCRAQAPFHKGETAGPNSSPHDQARSTPSLPPWGPALSQGSDVRRPPPRPPCSPRSPLSVLPGRPHPHRHSAESTPFPTAPASSGVTPIRRLGDREAGPAWPAWVVCAAWSRAVGSAPPAFTDGARPKLALKGRRRRWVLGASLCTPNSCVETRPQV